MTGLAEVRRVLAAHLHLPATVEVDLLRRAADAIEGYSRGHHDDRHQPKEPYWPRRPWGWCTDKWCRLDRQMVNRLREAQENAVIEQDPPRPDSTLRSMVDNDGHRPTCSRLAPCDCGAWLYTLADHAELTTVRLRRRLADQESRLRDSKARVRRVQEQAQNANRRMREADAKLAGVAALETAVERARLSAENYSRQAAILREQLITAGIEPDRRAG